MSTSVSSITKHFPSAENGFTTTLASTISSGATTVPLNSVAGYANGEVVVFIVDPSDAAKKQSFTGTVDTSGVQITGVVWTSGTNQTHTAGSTVVDYVDAAHISMVSKGLLVEHDQDGTHGAITPTSVVSSGPITGTVGTFNSVVINGTATSQGWTALGDVPDTVTPNASVPKVYDLVFNGEDHTDTLSNGMKLQLARTVAAPSQSTSLNGTTQYYSKSSPNKLTFTDDFVVSAWVKLSSYANGVIASRYNGTSGWYLQVNSSGQIQLLGANGGSGNTSYVLSNASIPLNKWVHVAAQLDMSTFTATTTTSYIMIDGVDVAASVARTGTNPTTLIQAGNLEIGSANSGISPFNGKIAQVAIYNAKVTQATILASINRGLSGSETSLASAYSFNNSITDLNTTTPNDLTAQGSAVATNADSPFANGVSAGSLEYAEVLNVAFSTNTTVTVRVPDGCQIPTSGGISSVLYSTQSNPYGLPRFSNIIGFVQVNGNSTLSSSQTTATQIPGLSISVYIPSGARIKVASFSSSITGTAGDVASSEIWDGAVVSGTQLTGFDTCIVATGNYATGGESTAKLTPTAGLHTFNASYRNSAARNIVFSGGTSKPAYLAVELV